MKHIAIVEDEFLMREELSSMLRKADYHVDEITEFEDVTAKLLELSPDLILLDINLPGLSGFQICQEIKQKSAIPLDFINTPDEYNEEVLIKTVGKSQREYIYLLGKTLRDKQAAYIELNTQLNDYEEYIESWAHEIKTPISLLTFLLDNRRDELSSTVSFKLDYIRSRMQESVGQMLFYARLKSTRKDYMIYSDRRGLNFILGQIVSNSIKYCIKEPELCFEPSQSDGCYILCVRDNGTGVRNCDLPYIFEKGFTGDSGEGRKSATGMGLYLAKEMAKELNIDLNASSRWERGFEMEITFPVVN